MIISLVLILGVIAAIGMILIVLIQNPKGGGLASNFSSSNQLFGAKNTIEGVEKITWIFAALIFAVSLLSSTQNGVKSEGSLKAADPEVNNMMDAPVPTGQKPGQP